MFYRAETRLASIRWLEPANTLTTHDPSQWRQGHRRIIRVIQHPHLLFDRIDLADPLSMSISPGD